MGLVNGDLLAASQSFDSNEPGNRTLTISMLEIKDSAGRVVTSNYQISKLDASGRIESVKPDPGPDPDPKPDPNPDPGTNPGGSAGGDSTAGNGDSVGSGGTDGTGGTGGTDGTGAGGSGSLPGGGVDERQRVASLAALLDTTGDDEEMKKKLRDRKLKNDYTLSIRNGGIRVPGEIFQEK